MYTYIVNNTYIIAEKIFWLLNNSIVSIEKAEKVVKDPKNPIIKKYLII